MFTKKIKIMKKRVILFGTFDGLHKGHLNFFKQARNLSKNSYVVVSIARDKNVKKIKGEYPILNEQSRMKLIKDLIKKNHLVDKVVLSGLKNHIPHILKEKPDIIALGYDQRAYVKDLKKDLKIKDKRNMDIKIVRLKPYKQKVYKNHLLKMKG
jgi:FAD synthetase